MTSVGRHPPTKKKNLFEFYDELYRFKLGADVSMMEMMKRWCVHDGYDQKRTLSKSAPFPRRTWWLSIFLRKTIRNQLNVQKYLEKALKKSFFLNSLWQQLFWWILNSPCLSEYPKCPKPSEAKVVGQMIIKETTCQCIKFWFYLFSVWWWYILWRSVCL